ncbi:hypothetical protein XELAEV_18003192mg [Xenopus laevis]|uniref:CCHC-type domain-containing protein n=1 Tax=Xenopus laevis TaxID=8355 RepID=A0A974BNA1_XENLA|nr:hypothetical protein XELAEV_18003192mg [Xenopus laevis]
MQLHQDTKSDMHNTIIQLQKEMAEIKSLLRNSVGNRTNTSKCLEPRQRTFKQSCEACKAVNQEQNCNHCFKCGQYGHLARGCRVTKQHSGNGWWLLQRDMQ